MGCRCAYAGTLGNTELSQFVIDRLRDEGIDTACVCRRADAQPVRSVVIVDESRQTRAILFDTEGALGADPLWPPEEIIRSAKVLFIDHFGIAGMIRAAQIGHGAGIPVVADLESADSPRFAELLSLVDHLILSRDFAQAITGQADPAAAAQSLWGPPRRAAVVTCGSAGCWYVSPLAPGKAVHQPAPAVEAVDTTGCGDVFHGAYAAALVFGLEIPAAVRFASAAAALKATRHGGQAGIPNRAAVEALFGAGH
jgi:sugar/nucleoside kinase (ribokinase family)